MRPTTLRSQLLSITGSSLFLFALCAGAAAWIVVHQKVSSADDAMAWVAALCVLASFSLPFLLVVREARRLSASVAALDSLAKALAGGAAAEAPQGLCATELVEAAGKLAHAANAARSRELALRSADRVKDEFLAMLAHELRNPLSVLWAAVSVLRQGAKQPEVLRAAQLIDRQVGQMTHLIEDLLDVARVTRGKASLRREPLDLAKIVEKAVSEMQLAGRLAGHAVRLDLAPAWVRADGARMQQVVANLLGNAVKYTPAGGSIVITLRRDPDEAILRVQDSGAGMSPELAARVFDLFVQGEGGERRGGGLGIGLALVRHLAELHGGKVFAASSGAGQGSVFTVVLPAIEAQAAIAAPVEAAPHAPRRILLVEDNADARNTLFAALELQGHRVYEAADGRAGMRALEAVKPDVAIVDIGLPDLPGYEIASALRENPAREAMVLIALTGLDGPETSRRALAAGFDDCVTKPIAPERLLRLVDAAFVTKARRAIEPRPPS
jgi:signal transduction histidine kinase/ActR/RegA family two-component response regulator